MKNIFDGKSVIDIISNYNRLKKEVFFIQIGSNKGEDNDFLRNFIINDNWHGILIEPIKYLFRELKKNYQFYKDQLIFENLAVDITNSIKPIYYLKIPKNNSLPDWSSQIGSLNKSIVLKHKKYISDIDNYLTKEYCNTITLDTLIIKHQVKKVDLIQIDAEGHDYEILKTINFRVIKPEIIIFEYIHLSKKDFAECIFYLEKMGYKILKNNHDAIAVLFDIYASL